MRKQPSLEAYQNNTAATFIEGGNYRDAIACLSTSIMEFEFSDREGCESCQRACCPETAKAMSIDQYMLYNQESFKEDGKPYLYKNPIRLPNELNVICKKCRHDLLSIAMVFNLALSHHLQALHISNSPSNINATDSDLHLQKAIILYELAFGVIQTKEQFVGPNYILALAIINNLAIIYRIRNNEALANNGFQRMLSILMYLVESGKNGQCGKLEGFQYNISLGSSQRSRENFAGAA